MKSRKHTSRFLLGLWALMGVLSLSSVLRAADAPKQAAGAGSTVVLNAKEYADANPSAKTADQGDPGGSVTGNPSDVAVADAKAGLTLTDVAAQAGQNKVAINFVWTLVTGFLVMFMQAGFALVETGLIRAKSANHTMMMNFMVYGLGLFAYWVCGFAIQMGGCAPIANLGGTYPLNVEKVVTLFGKPWGLFGMKGFFLSGATYDVGVMVLFLFQMVFMDTTTTIVTGTCAERWKYSAFAVSTIFLGAITYPLFGNRAWGCGWLSQ